MTSKSIRIRLNVFAKDVFIPSDDPVETTVPAEGFLLLWLDGEPEEGASFGHDCSFENQIFLDSPDNKWQMNLKPDILHQRVVWSRT